MRPEYKFGHLDQPGESGGGAEAWKDAALLPPSPIGSFSPGGAESLTTSMSLKKLRLFCFRHAPTL
jgi:hypothetical protein